MAEGIQGWDAPFDRLPDEVVVNIFSYCSLNTLVDVLQNVCGRWKRLVHTPALWLDKEYAIRGSRWRLQGRTCCGVYFSECRHCLCHKTDEEVLQAVGTMPQLRKLTIMRAIRGRILREVCENCPNLTNLHIECSQVANYPVMKHIFEKCPKIQKLKLPAGMLSNVRFAELLSCLKHLTCLIVIQDFRNSGYVKLRNLADACQHLEEIHTDCNEYDIRDMEYFLKAKKHCLTSATLYWTLGIMEKWCALRLLKRCETSLRKLRLLHFYMRPETETAAFEALGELHTLQELRADHVAPHLPELFSIPFRPGCLPQLRRLHMRYASNLPDEAVLTISRGCPNLCELRLTKSEFITDAALNEIHHLKHLETLELSGCNGLGGAAVALIAQLPALRTLILQLLDLEKLLPSLQEIVNMRELSSLDIFKSHNISSVPFKEFPDRLVNLRELRVSAMSEDRRLAELQRLMPRLRIFNSFRDSEDEFFSGLELSGGEGCDAYYAGDDFYYGFNDDDEEEEDDDEDDV